MRAGIFVKDILDQETAAGQVKLNSSDQLRTGDRIIALTVCFESIVYEDALTILSYASPYPVSPPLSIDCDDFSFVGIGYSSCSTSNSFITSRYN